MEALEATSKMVYKFPVVVAVGVRSPLPILLETVKFKVANPLQISSSRQPGRFRNHPPLRAQNTIELMDISLLFTGISIVASRAPVWQTAVGAVPSFIPLAIIPRRR
jgi:hypothetical protein